MNHGKNDITSPVSGLVLGPSDQAQGRPCAGGDKVKAMDFEDPEILPLQEARRLLQELRVHQIKLEKQNEELLAVGQDITERKQAVEEKIQLQSHRLEAWGMIAAGMAHELRNLLAVINSCTLFCLEESIKAPLRENLEMIRRNGQSANNIIKKLLNLAATSDLEFGPVDLNEVVLEMWDMIKVFAPDKKIFFIRKLDPQLPEIQGDREKLKQVFNNLFLNAIQAVSNPGKIIVETKSLPSRHIEVRITDDGPGISKEDLEKIFHPFYSTKKEGMGLGLNCCKWIANQHNGKITADSVLGQGTRFSVRLPVHQDIKE